MDVYNWNSFIILCPDLAPVSIELDLMISFQNDSNTISYKFNNENIYICHYMISFGPEWS